MAQITLLIPMTPRASMAPISSDDPDDSGDPQGSDGPDGGGSSVEGGCLEHVIPWPCYPGSVQPGPLLDVSDNNFRAFKFLSAWEGFEQPLHATLACNPRLLTRSRKRMGP